MLFFFCNGMDGVVGKSEFGGISVIVLVFVSVMLLMDDVWGDYNMCFLVVCGLYFFYFSMVLFFIIDV